MTQFKSRKSDGQHFPITGKKGISMKNRNGSVEPTGIRINAWGQDMSDPVFNRKRKIVENYNLALESGIGIINAREAYKKEFGVYPVVGERDIKNLARHWKNQPTDTMYWVLSNINHANEASNLVMRDFESFPKHIQREAIERLAEYELAMTKLSRESFKKQFENKASEAFGITKFKGVPTSKLKKMEEDLIVKHKLLWDKIKDAEHSVTNAEAKKEYDKTTMEINQVTQELSGRREEKVLGHRIFNPEKMPSSGNWTPLSYMEFQREKYRSGTL